MEIKTIERKLIKEGEEVLIKCVLYYASDSIQENILGEMIRLVYAEACQKCPTALSYATAKTLTAKTGRIWLGQIGESSTALVILADGSVIDPEWNQYKLV